MAKILTEQFNCFPPRATDTVLFGDAAPLESRMPLDLVRGLNNAQTYCEPSFGFAFDISWNPVGVGGGQCQYQRPTSAYAASGTALLGQVPILVPTQAWKLCYSLGVYRFPAIPETPIQVNVTKMTLYLASKPVTALLTPGAVPIPVQGGRTFQPSYISGPYSSTFETMSLVDSSTQYEYHDGSTWTDFLTPYNINDRLIDPWAILIATVDFDTMDVNEKIQAGEFSWWFEYK